MMAEEIKPMPDRYNFLVETDISQLLSTVPLYSHATRLCLSWQNELRFNPETCKATRVWEQAPKKKNFFPRTSYKNNNEGPVSGSVKRGSQFSSFLH